MSSSEEMNEDNTKIGDIIFHISESELNCLTDKDSNLSNNKSTRDINHLGQTLLNTKCNFITHKNCTPGTIIILRINRLKNCLLPRKAAVLKKSKGTLKIFSYWAERNLHSALLYFLSHTLKYLLENINI